MRSNDEFDQYLQSLKEAKKSRNKINEEMIKKFGGKFQLLKCGCYMYGSDGEKLRLFTR